MRGGGRTAELHKVMNTHTQRTGKRNPFCLRVRRGGMCLRERDFWMKVAELFLWCSEMSTLHNGYSGKFALGLFRQLLTTPNGEGFFSLAMWGKFSLNQAFLKMLNTTFSSLGWIYWGGTDHGFPHIPAWCTHSVLAVVGNSSSLGTAKEHSAPAEVCWSIIPAHINTWDVPSFSKRMF